MRLLVLLLLGAVGALVSAWGLPRGGRAARFGALVGVTALAGVTGAAFLLRRGNVSDTLTGIFGAHLVGTEFLRLVVGLWGIESLLLVFAAWLLGGLPRLRGLLPATLAAMTGGTVAMAAADLGVGAAAAAATGLAALVVILGAEGPAAVAAGARELRVALVSGTALLVALTVVPLAAQLALIASGVGRDEATAAAPSIAGPVLGLITLAVGLVVCARWGLLPFHVRVSRLTDLVPPETLPLLLVWTAVPMTIVALAAFDQLIASLALPALSLDGERAVLVLLALATLGGASLAAFFHDDLRHTVAYLVIADAGLLLLAIAALDPVAWGPGRAWVVTLAASKTALGAWAAVTEDRFETRSIPDLRGWIRRSPLLAAAFVLATIATFGLPGWLALESRVALAQGVWGSPWRELLVLGGLLTLPTYARLAGVGLGRVTSRVDRAAPERLIRRRKPLERLPVEQESADGTVSIDAGAPTVGRAAAAAALAGAAMGSRSMARGAAARVRSMAVRARGAATDATSSVREVAANRRAGRRAAGPSGDPGAPAVEVGVAAAEAGGVAAGSGIVTSGGDAPASGGDAPAPGGDVAAPGTTRGRRGAAAARAASAAVSASAPLPLEPEPAPVVRRRTRGELGTGTNPVVTAGSGAAAPDAGVVAASGGPAAREAGVVAARRRERAAGRAPGVLARASAAGGRIVATLRRDRTELLSGAVLALAILATLTSWGALNLDEAARESPPILRSGTSD